MKNWICCILLIPITIHPIAPVNLKPHPPVIQQTAPVQTIPPPVSVPDPSTTAKNVTDLGLFPDGTVLVSRNRIERENTSPGFWNHLAIISQGHVVEAQKGPGVIRTSFSVYLGRDYSRILVLEPQDLDAGVRAAAISESLVGLKFNILSSFPGKDRPLLMQVRGVNCDSVIRYSERQATGLKLRTLRIPDSVLHHPEVFRSPIAIR